MPDNRISEKKKVLRNLPRSDDRSGASIKARNSSSRCADGPLSPHQKEENLV